MRETARTQGGAGPAFRRRSLSGTGLRRLRRRASPPQSFASCRASLPALEKGPGGSADRQSGLGLSVDAAAYLLETGEDPLLLARSRHEFLKALQARLGHFGWGVAVAELRRRAAFGRGIVRNPGVFLFDGPLANLDAGGNRRALPRACQCVRLHRPRSDKGDDAGRQDRRAARRPRRRLLRPCGTGRPNCGRRVPPARLPGGLVPACLQSAQAAIRRCAARRSGWATLSPPAAGLAFPP